MEIKTADDNDAETDTEAKSETKSETTAAEIQQSKSKPILASYKNIGAYFNPASHRSIYDLGPYHNYDEFHAELDRLQSLDIKNVELSEYGESVKGRPLRKIVLSPSVVNEKTPEVLVSSLIHGVELIGGEVCLAVIKRLVEDLDTHPWLKAVREKARFTFVPMMNPDAFCKNTERLSNKKITLVRKNANRTDLNRNFPYKEGLKLRHPASGSKKFKWHPSYLGSHPLCEPETKLFANMVRAQNFKLSWSYHSMSGLVLIPSGHTKRPSPDHERFLEIANCFKTHQTHYPYKIIQSSELYPTIGNMDDWLYDELGILPITLEVSRPSHVFSKRFLNPFWWMNPINKSVWVQNDCDATIKALEKGLSLL